MGDEKFTHKSLSIKELIRQVHRELVESQKERESEGEEALFQVESLTLEVNFVVTKSSDAKGGIDFKVITAGLGDNYAEQQIHKVTLSLKVPPEKAASRILTDPQNRGGLKDTSGSSGGIPGISPAGGGMSGGSSGGGGGGAR